MIIDSHCHLDYEPIASEIEGVLSRAKDNGIKFFLTISVEDKKYKNIIKIISNYPNVYGTYGIHPHEAKSHTHIKAKNILEKVKLSNKIIGIGETGLDFFYNHSEKKVQLALLEEHIYASQESNLPLIIHSRSAEKETFDMLYKHKRIKNFKLLLHCFTGSKNFAKKLIDIGSYISASGIITFKNSIDLAETFKQIPNNRILVETDSPYLAPEPLRGKSNEPSNIIHTIKFLSNIKKIEYETFIKITFNNFISLFGDLDK